MSTAFQRSLQLVVKELRKHHPTTLLYSGSSVVGITGDTGFKLPIIDESYKRETGTFTFIGLTEDFYGNLPEAGDEVEVDGENHTVEQFYPRTPPGLVLLDLR